MNKDNARDYLPLVRALAEGKMVQGRYRNLNGEREWCDMSGEIAFDGPASDYRIKPKPREFFMNLYPDGTEDGPFDNAYSASTHLRLNGAVILYREVIE